MRGMETEIEGITVIQLSFIGLGSMNWFIQGYSDFCEEILCSKSHACFLTEVDSDFMCRRNQDICALHSLPCVPPGSPSCHLDVIDYVFSAHQYTEKVWD